MLQGLLAAQLLAAILLALAVPSALADEPPLEPAPGDNLICLGEKGLRPGDVIDPYIEEWFKDGNQVRVPAGTYQWELTQIGPAENASFIGEGMVVLDCGDRLDRMHIINLTSSTAMEVRNVTVKGRARGRGAIVRLWATEPDAVVIARNVRLPDGGDDTRVGMFVVRQHEGTAWVIDCEVTGFADNGLYGSAPIVPAGRNGTVHVRRGLYRNNNISGVRLGSSGSSVIGTVIINDDLAPLNRGRRNQRGIWILHGRDGVVIEDCDITHTVGSWSPIVISAHETFPASGTIRNVRIRSESETPAIQISGGQWTGGGICLSGGGNLEITGGHFDALRYGEAATPPRTEPRPSRTDPSSPLPREQ